MACSNQLCEVVQHLLALTISLQALSKEGSSHQCKGELGALKPASQPPAGCDNVTCFSGHKDEVQNR